MKLVTESACMEICQKKLPNNKDLPTPYNKPVKTWCKGFIKILLYYNIVNTRRTKNRESCDIPKIMNRWSIQVSMIYMLFYLKI